ncbi:glutamyl-tRNA reductase [Abyssicoccus albus]|uniref:Glutamyl-tRNA reductase n=1 Tax=Abyssicoccus albus TaxID=1817405 RepID=A0A3N5CJ78_9BACL|nr:glutamyl-tRNA reductase [Abyssicoccus albus]RPF57771.1 glutamyl-tRNA reductase [Abyssicoccus albus]
MHTLAVSINYKTARVDLREQVAFNDSNIEKAVLELKDTKSILENVILSTCNRTEIYAVVDQLHTGKYYIARFLSEWFDIDIEDIKSMMTINVDADAYEHLFKVNCGLDSMVLGETQILGQIKEAFERSHKLEATGTMFNKLFKQSMTLAKRAHRDTKIAESAVSISYAAVELSRKVFDSFTNKHIAVVGAGEMAKLAIENFKGRGANHITVMNRTETRAIEIASDYNIKHAAIDRITDVINDADIILTATGATEYIIGVDTLQHVSNKNKQRVFLDISLPRNIDPNIKREESLYLYDVDALNGLIDYNLKERQQAAAQIEQMINDEQQQFTKWLDMLGVVPVITALREKALTIQAETMVSIENKMPNMSERERKVISKHTKSIINQMLKDPIQSAKELAGESHGHEKLEFFMDIFDIEEDVVALIEAEKDEAKRAKYYRMKQLLNQVKTIR